MWPAGCRQAFVLLHRNRPPPKSSPLPITPVPPSVPRWPAPDSGGRGGGGAHRTPSNSSFAGPLHQRDGMQAEKAAVDQLFGAALTISLVLCAQMELEDAIHTAILTLKEGFEGQMTENNIEISVIGVRWPDHRGTKEMIHSV